MYSGLISSLLRALNTALSPSNRVLPYIEICDREVPETPRICLLTGGPRKLRLLSGSYKGFFLVLTKVLTKVSFLSAC